MTASFEQSNNSIGINDCGGSEDEFEGPPLLSEYARELLLNKSQDDDINIQQTTATILSPSSPSPSSTKWTNYCSPNDDKQQQLMTPASINQNNNNNNNNNHHPTTTRTRIRRFGKGLGPPKRAAPRALDNNNNNNNIESNDDIPGDVKILLEEKPSSVLNPLSPNQINKSPVIPELVLPTRKKETNGKKNKNIITVNGKSYNKLQVIGKGGSSKVFKVQSNNGSKTVTFALKRVTFNQEIDIEGFKGEINLLNKLRQVDKVIKLHDFEITDNHIYVIMECGEIDFAHMLNARLNEPLDLRFTRYYGSEMIKCVDAVHNYGIVHADLKPANFILVKGKLKIIDFGIAASVPQNTLNIQRDTIMGTLNYMAPEALMTLNDNDVMKIGKPSDIWSCGCILYQMIYSRPPFDLYNLTQRIKEITNPNQSIKYPKFGIGNVPVPNCAIKTIQSCLIYNIPDRITSIDILNGEFFSPRNIDSNILRKLVENGIQYGAQYGIVDDQTLDLMMERIISKIG